MQDIRIFGLKQEFIKWINAGNSESYDLSVVVSCLEKVSEYAIRKKICQTSFWNISQYFTFELIYQKLLKSVQMQILERNTYKKFIHVGKLYLKFLKEKPYLQQANEPNFSVMTIAGRDTKADSDTATIILPTIQNVETAINPFEMDEKNPTIDPFETAVEETAIIPLETTLDELAIPPSEMEEDEPTIDLFETVLDESAIPPSEIEEDEPTIDLFETAVEEKAIIPFEITMEASEFPQSEIEEDEPTSNPFEIAMETSAIPPSEIEEDDPTSNPFETTMGEWEFPPSEMDFEEIEIFPFEKEVEETVTISSETKIEESSILPKTKQPEKRYLKEINPDEMIAWLITQRNENGTRYLKFVVERYVHSLKYAPAKLDLPPGVNRNVFSCQSVEEFNMLWERYKAAPNFESINEKHYGRLSEGLNCLSRYVSYLTENQNEKILFNFIQKPTPSIEQPKPDTARSDPGKVVDFNKPEQYQNTKPVSCKIQGKEIFIDSQYWNSVLVEITEWLIKECNPCLPVLNWISLYGSQPFFLHQKPGKITSRLLSNGKWISVNYSANTIVTVIGNLLRHCKIPFEDVVITYAPENRMISDVKKQPLVRNIPKVIDEAVITIIKDILVKYFPNGFRLDSPIELKRFRNYSADDHAENIPLFDEDLQTVIRLCGTLFQGKVYVIEEETESRLKEEIDSQITCGVEIIYYSSFYDRHESWLFDGRIISDDMLKQILMGLYPAFTHKPGYFTIHDHRSRELSIIKNEILRIWNHDVLLDYDQIAARLPYIPLDKIKYALAMDNGFIWNSKDVYTHIGMVDISEEERFSIQEYVENTCLLSGYVSINDIPLKAIEEHNNELSLTAIHSAVYSIALSDYYDKHGKIITRKGDSLDARLLMKEKCRSTDTCSLKELIQYEQELTGDTYTWIALEAGYSVLVRTSEESFVAEKFVHFDCEAIDSALDIFVTGQYLPLKGVTTFAAFPDCGQLWNLFLLESYLRRFSNRYRFDSLTMNSQNAGVIIRKDCSLSYPEIITDAVAASNVDLTKTAVIEYLYKGGYLGRRVYNRIDELIEQVKTLREREH